MQFCLSLLTQSDYENEKETLQRFLAEKNQLEVEHIKSIIFTDGVGKEVLQDLSVSDTLVSLLRPKLTWQEYLNEFDEFFAKHFILMFDGPTYLLLPARQSYMSAALTLKSLEYLGDDVIPYAYQDNQFIQIKVEQIAPKKDLKYLLVHFLKHHDYVSALGIIKQDDFLKSAKNQEYAQAIHWAIKAMVKRTNCDFTRAIECWEQTEIIWREQPQLGSNTLQILDRLAGQGQISEREKIHELIRQVLLRLHTGDISGFLTRMYRLRELLINYIWTYISKGESRALRARLPAYEQLDCLRTEMASGKIQGHRAAYFYLKNANLAATLKLRNKSFIGHGREGFDTKDWVKAYMGGDLSIYEAIEDFEQELSFLLEDMGMHRDDNYQQISTYLWKAVRSYL